MQGPGLQQRRNPLLQHLRPHPEFSVKIVPAGEIKTGVAGFEAAENRAADTADRLRLILQPELQRSGDAARRPAIPPSLRKSAVTSSRLFPKKWFSAHASSRFSPSAGLISDLDGVSPISLHLSFPVSCGNSIR